MKKGIAVVLLLLLALCAPPRLEAETGPSPADGEPRVLVLALDGVPYRLLLEARKNGSFEGWPEARPLVSTFPSMTNVSFTAMLSPLGAEPARGYEVRHYDPDRNRVHGGGFASKKKSFAWKNLFDVISKGNYAKARIYMTPKSMVRAELDKVTEAVLESTKEFMLAHVASTDMLKHFGGDPAALEALEEAAESVDELRCRHIEERGRPLRVVMLSDHGNTSGKVEVAVGDMKKVLEAADLHFSQKLKHHDDVVLAAYGLVGYAAFFSDPGNAETIASSILEVDGIDIAAWRSDQDELSVRTFEGLARVHWRGPPERRKLRYVREYGDPLGLSEIVPGMEAAGLFDEEGYASREDWFEQTASAEYPDGLARLTDSMSGTWVAHPATVIVSLKPGYACGTRSVRVGTWFRGGHLEGTHGSLERESSWGFFLDSDEGRSYPPVLRVDQVLAQFADRNERGGAEDPAP